MSGGDTGVFVLGMHRSGTSATARAVNLLGVPLAADDELEHASPKDPTASWEVTRLTDFNDRLLAELGGSSLGPPALEPGWSRRQSLEPRRRRGRRLLKKTHPTDTWVWNEPRNCILLPFWREALDVRPVAMIVHRGPVGVARSLAASEGLSTAMSFAVWERYMRQALAAVEGLPVFIVSYANLVGESRGWARAVMEFLCQQGLDCDAEGGVERVTDFVESRPRRGDDAPAPPAESPPAPAAPSFELSDSQAELVVAVERLAGPHEGFVRPALPPETVWTEPLLAERRRADILRQQMDERLRATRHRLRTARAGKSDAEWLPKRVAGRRGAGRIKRLSARRPRGAAGGQDGGGRLPDYLIIGAQKSGTSSLFRYLGESPDVDLPMEKEIHFFDNHFDRGVDWYRSHFPPRARRRRLTGEASPYYMFHPLVPQRTRDLLPEVRLIALLRNPADRAVSHYYHELGNGVEELPLPVALDREHDRLAGESERIVAEPGYSSFNHRHFSYQARGVYADQLELWRSFFPEDQLLVLNSDDLFERPVEEMRRVYEFLGLPGSPGQDLGAYNQRDYPAMPPEVEARLRERFAPHNARLYELVGKDYGWESR